MPASDTLGTGVWKGTPRASVERLLSIVTLTTSPLLNDLMRRLLTTPATPPASDAATPSDSAQSLTAQRVEKLVTFGDTDEAWALASHADAKLIDDITFHFAAEAELANDGDEVCKALPNAAKTRGSVDWRRALVICALRVKDTKVAQDTLALLDADANRDGMFIEVATKDVLGDGKSLPHQLTPLTPPMLALLRLTPLPLPGDLYGHPDFALAHALLHATAKQDVAQLGLAERAAQRGVIDSAELGALYHAVTFAPDELATPLTASESGSRQRALLYQSALNEKQPFNRIADTIKFVQSAPPALLNGAGVLVGDMLGIIKPDPTLADNAVSVAQIYLTAGRGDLALDWLRLAKRNPQAASDLQALWPQFTLSGLESETDYTPDLAQWLDATLKSADPQADPRAARDSAATALLLLDAAGFAVPDTAWVKVLAAAHSEKRSAFSPVLLTRLQETSVDGRRGETLLLATALASDGEITLPVACAITRALREAGLKGEAATFARHTLVLQTKSN
jgi:hypothetical protein